MEGDRSGVEVEIVRNDVSSRATGLILWPRDALINLSDCQTLWTATHACVPS